MIESGVGDGEAGNTQAGAVTGSAPASRPSGSERIGFVGAGMMGHGICVNLLAAGYPVTVVAHRNRAPIEDLVARGAAEARGLSDLAAGASVVMVCVNDAETVASVVDQIAPHLAADALVVDVTTSKPEVSRRLAAALAPRGIGFVDAPVVGGPAQAAEGRLGTFLGASDDALARVRPIVEAYSVEVAHFGAVGAGNTAKLLNNFLTVGLRQLVTQAFRAARRHDIDTDKLYALSAKGAAGSRTLDQLASGLTRGEYTQNKFSIANCYKDMSYTGPLLAGDPDGRAIQEAMLAAYARLIEAGCGDRLAGEMLDPEVERLTR